MRLIISLRRKQWANHGMLQEELITSSRNSAIQNPKLLLKMPISNLGEIWSNTALFKFGLSKSYVGQLPRPKLKFKDDFLNICESIIPLSMSFHKIGKKQNNISVIFTSHFLQYSKVHYYTQFYKPLRGHRGSNRMEIFGSCNAKT